MFNTENKHFRINVVGFSIVGILFYCYSFYQDPTTIKANPLYSDGFIGLFVSLIGASFTYFYFRYNQCSIIKVLFLAAILFVIWMGGVIYLQSTLTGAESRYAMVAWIGLLTIMYFMFLGAINGLLGFWISLFNLAVLGKMLLSGGGTEPFLWVNVLGLAGVDNPILLWGLVLISGVLGISDKGYDFFIHQQG